MTTATEAPPRERAKALWLAGIREGREPSARELAEAVGVTDRSIRNWRKDWQAEEVKIAEKPSEPPKPTTPTTRPETNESPSESHTEPPSNTPEPISGGRFVAWLAFVLGTAASVAANVLHAEPTLAARIAGAVVPLSLLLSVEVLMRLRWRAGGNGWKAAVYFGAAVVASVSAAVSYRHQMELLLMLGEDEFNATIAPLAVDGLLLVGGVALLRCKRRNEP